MSRGATRAVAAGVVAAAAARAAYSALRRRPPAGEKTWARTNHRGESLTLLEGPAVALGAVAGAVVTGAVVAGGGFPGVSRQGAAVVLAGAAGAALGCYDDLAGSGSSRGLRGHLGALARGEVTTGSVKLGGLGAAGLASAALIGGDPVDAAINSGLIAGGANLLNLFDLRPGRAIKVATASAALIEASALVRSNCCYGDTSYGYPAAGRAGGAAGRVGGAVGGHAGGTAYGQAALGAAVGASLALLPEDLGERAMLGDTGANAIGAMLGAAAALTLPRPARAGLLTGIVALTAASEKVSFTKVIERTPWLHRLDMLGRRPPSDQ